MVPAHMKQDYVIRFCVCAPNATVEDIDRAINIIRDAATMVLRLDMVSRNALIKHQFVLILHLMPQFRVWANWKASSVQSLTPMIPIIVITCEDGSVLPACRM